MMTRIESGRFIKYARWFASLGAIIILAGCSAAPTQQVQPPEPSAPAPQVWSGPAEFSADYLWSANRPAAAFDRPVKLVRILVRQGRAVRAVGLDVFGATLFDELILSVPGDKTRTRFRQGAENIDGLLLEQALRLIFFQQKQNDRVVWLSQDPGIGGRPAKELKIKIGDDVLELQLAGSTVAPQVDADFDYPAEP